MKRGKYESTGHGRRRMTGGKFLALILTLALLAGTAVGGTLAWLTADTETVENTFTASDIRITLAESDDLNLKMVPGCTITKDPRVTVKAGSEKCYLFVRIETSANFDKFMTYAVDPAWEPLDGVDGVYCRVVEASDSDQPFRVLKNDQVAVKETVTREMMNALTEDSRPTLTVTAYASQYWKNNTESFSAAEAWENVNPAPQP